MLTSEKEIRETVKVGAARKASATGRDIDPELIERLIEQHTKAARDEGTLLTDRQLSDHRVKRKLLEGDYARYVGLERDEPIGKRDAVQHRPFGQVGRIVGVGKHGVHDIVTFRPLADVLLRDESLVELVVREGTMGYYDLERLYDDEVD